MSDAAAVALSRKVSWSRNTAQWPTPADTFFPSAPFPSALTAAAAAAVRDSAVTTAPSTSTDCYHCTQHKHRLCYHCVTAKGS